MPDLAYSISFPILLDIDIAPHHCGEGQWSSRRLEILLPSATPLSEPASESRRHLPNIT